MFTAVLTLCLLLASGADRLEFILTFDPNYVIATGEPRRLAVDAGHTTVVSDLELGDSVEGALVDVLSRSSKISFHVQVQYETSVSISNEGPHLDLVDWKHHTSEWRDLQPVGTTRFRIPGFSQEERSRFPRVSAMELKEAVRAAGGDGWLELVRSVTSVHDAPASVDISLIRLRVTEVSGGGPKPTFTVEFLITMGC